MDSRVAMTRIGDACLSLNDVPGAEESYRRALEMGYDKWAHLGLAKIHIRRNESSKARDILDMLLEKEPGDARVILLHQQVEK
jgi:hypothetical protein